LFIVDFSFFFFFFFFDFLIFIFFQIEIKQTRDLKSFLLVFQRRHHQKKRDKHKQKQTKVRFFKKSLLSAKKMSKERKFA